MAYEIELIVGDRTYHYGSVDAYRHDMESRFIRIKRLGANANRDGITEERKAELFDMLEYENNMLVKLSDAMQEKNREYFQSIEGTPAP